MSLGSLSEASSSVFVAVKFVLLGFCISGTLVFARKHVLNIDVIVYICICFLKYFFCCSVFWGHQPDHIPAIMSGLFCCLTCSELQCILQCNVLYCSALYCNLQSFHCSLFTFLIFLFYSGHSQERWSNWSKAQVNTWLHLVCQ